MKEAQIREFGLLEIARIFQSHEATVYIEALTMLIINSGMDFDQAQEFTIETMRNRYKGKGVDTTSKRNSIRKARQALEEY